MKSKEAVQASAEGNIKLRTSENIDFPVLRKPPGSEKAAPYTEILWPDKTIDGKSYKEAFIDEIKLRNKFPQKSTQARAAGVLTNEQLMKKYGIRSTSLLNKIIDKTKTLENISGIKPKVIYESTQFVKGLNQSILSTLKRHINAGGTDFKFAKDGNVKDWSKVKIIDVKKGDILTEDVLEKLIKNKDPRFTEYKKVYDDIIKIKNTPFVHPVTKEKMTLFRGLQLATDKDAPLHMQHEKLVKNSPLKKLSPSIGKTNLGLGQLKNFTAEDLKKLGIRSVLPGGEKVYGPKLTVEQRIKDYGKWVNRKLLEGDPSTIKTPKNIIKHSIASQIRTMDGETISAYKDDYPDCFKNQGGKNAIACLSKQAEKNQEKFVKNSVNIAKATEGTKTSGQMINFLKKFRRVGKLTGWLAVGEAAFAPLMGIPMWAQGTPKDEIAHTLSYGLFGTKHEDKLLGRMSDLGKTIYKTTALEAESMRFQKALESAPETGYEKLRINQRLKELAKEYEEAAKIFINPDTGEYNQNLVDQGYQEVEEATTYLSDIKTQNVKDRAAWMAPKVSSVMEKVVDKPGKAFIDFTLGPNWKENLPEQQSQFYKKRYPRNPRELGQHLSYDPDIPMFAEGGIASLKK